MPTLKLHSSTQQYGDWYTGYWWVGCYIWYSEEGPGWAGAPPSPLLTVPNVTAHPSMASVPTSYYLMWHYNKGLKLIWCTVWNHNVLSSLKSTVSLTWLWNNCTVPARSQCRGYDMSLDCSQCRGYDVSLDCSQCRGYDMSLDCSVQL